MGRLHKRGFPLLLPSLAAGAAGDPELGFYKFYFLLLSRRILPRNEYHIYLDERSSNRDGRRLGDLKDCVNGWCARNRTGGIWPVRTLEPRDSKTDDLIQLGDVILGAVGRRCNSVTGSESKDTLTAHVEARVGRPLDRGTTGDVRPFNVWRWRPDPRHDQRKRPPNP